MKSPEPTSPEIGPLDDDSDDSDDLSDGPVTVKKSAAKAQGSVGALSNMVSHRSFFWS
jgi:hypothetical protein